MTTKTSTRSANIDLPRRAAVETAHVTDQSFGGACTATATTLQFGADALNSRCRPPPQPLTASRCHSLRLPSCAESRIGRHKLENRQRLDVVQKLSAW